MIVMKFGGTSVKDAEAVDRVANIVKGRIERKQKLCRHDTGENRDRPA